MKLSKYQRLAALICTPALKFSNLYYKKVGTTIGSLIKNEVIPHHDLAWSIHKSETIQTIECNQEQSIQFLKKELQSIDGNKGWNLMSNKGFGIGWIKHLGNRLNNYFIVLHIITFSAGVPALRVAAERYRQAIYFAK